MAIDSDPLDGFDEPEAKRSIFDGMDEALEKDATRVASKPGRVMWRNEAVKRLAAMRAKPHAPQGEKIITAPGEPVRLRVLDVRELTAPGDRFRCAPYSAVLRAGECVKRQAEQDLLRHNHVFRGVVRGPRTKNSGTSGFVTTKCLDCALGRAVRARLEPAPSTPVSPACPVCGLWQRPCACTSFEAPVVEAITPPCVDEPSTPAVG